MTMELLEKIPGRLWSIAKPASRLLWAAIAKKKEILSIVMSKYSLTLFGGHYG
jgi:hypothetical protein